jgi:hypothetical protein
VKNKKQTPQRYGLFLLSFLPLTNHYHIPSADENSKELNLNTSETATLLPTSGLPSLTTKNQPLPDRQVTYDWSDSDLQTPRFSRKSADNREVDRYSTRERDDCRSDRTDGESPLTQGSSIASTPSFNRDQSDMRDETETQADLKYHVFCEDIMMRGQRLWSLSRNYSQRSGMTVKRERKSYKRERERKRVSCWKYKHYDAHYKTRKRREIVGDLRFNRFQV